MATGTTDIDHDIELVRRARGGDHDAFRDLVELHGPQLVRLAQRLVGEPEAAEDVAQEALLKAFRALGRFDGRCRFGTWLHRITTNCALDHLRLQSRHPGAEPAGEPPEGLCLTSAEPGPLRQAQAAEVRSRVAASLDRLTPLERAAFVLRHYEECSLAEVGRILGRGENTAKQTVFRAVHKLRRELSPLVREPRPRGARS